MVTQFEVCLCNSKEFYLVCLFRTKRDPPVGLHQLNSQIKLVAETHQAKFGVSSLLATCSHSVQSVVQRNIWTQLLLSTVFIQRADATAETNEKHTQSVDAA